MNKSIGGYCLGVLGLLGIIFITLKLCGVIGWPMWWVTSPFWGIITALPFCCSLKNYPVVIMGFLVLGLISLALKCFSAIEWSWWWAMAPLLWFVISYILAYVAQCVLNYKTINFYLDIIKKEKV